MRKGLLLGALAAVLAARTRPVEVCATYSVPLRGLLLGLVAWTLACAGEPTSADGPCAVPLPRPSLVIEDVIPESGGYLWYILGVPNHAQFPDALFESAPDLPPCGLNANASRTWAEILRGDNGNVIYGYCGLASGAELDDMSFLVQPDQVPATVVVRLTDRRCGRESRSDAVSTAGVQ